MVDFLGVRVPWSGIFGIAMSGLGMSVFSNFGGPGLDVLEFSKSPTLMYKFCVGYHSKRNALRRAVEGQFYILKISKEFSGENETVFS